MKSNEHALTLFEFDMKINESVPRWDKIIEGVREHRDEWALTAEASH